MTPTIGRIVHVRLSKDCAARARKQREDCECLHGNSIREGDEYPMLIVKVWPDTPGHEKSVNGQIFLDGNDTLWATSVCEDDSPEGMTPGTWHWPERT